MTGRQRVRWLLVLGARLVGWLALGAVVGAAAWGALTWAGSAPQTARWVALGIAVVTAAAAGVARSMPGPARPDERPEAPPAS